MGYAAEKKEAERKWGRVKLVTLLAVLLAVLVFVLVSIWIPLKSWKYRVALPKVGKRADGEMRIHFLDVGQGDATVIELPDGKIALIDGGDSSKQTEYALMRYLYALKVKTIDYLILTHAEEDHCGALDVVLQHFEVKHAYLPLASTTVNNEYAQFYQELLKEKDCQREYAQNGLRLDGENYTFAFLYPYGWDLDNAINSGWNFDKYANEYSAVTYLEYNGVGTLFTGDLPAEKEMILANAQASGILSVDISDTEILKVGHHGSAYSTSLEFLQTLGTETAVISCGENSYGHPAKETIERLATAGVKVYRTDEKGSVIVCVGEKSQGYTVSTLGK